MTYIGFTICIFVAAKMQWLGISFAKLKAEEKGGR